MSNKAELACVYAALVLVDDDIPVTVSTFHQIETTVQKVSNEIT